MVWNQFRTIINIAPRQPPSHRQPDWFDRVSIDYAKGTTNNEFNVVWQKSNNIYLNIGAVNFTTGAITWSTSNYLLFQSGAAGYPGSFSNPDVAAQAGHIAVSTLYKNSNEQKVVVKTSDVLIFYTTDAYTLNSAVKQIRTPRVDEGDKYGFAVCFNELDHSQKKSSMILAAKYQKTSSLLGPVIINSEMENLCTANTNYKLTGFPNIRFTDPANAKFEIVWQQIFCSSGNFCDINAISKRFIYSLTAITPQNSNQYFQINSDLSRNTVFPAIASEPGTCLTAYSFGIMDKNSSANGQVAYKKSTCNGTAVRPAPNTIVAAAQNNKGSLLYPNPVNDVLFIDMAAIKGFCTVAVYNANGITVLQSAMQGGKLQSLKVASLPQGTYTITISSTGMEAINQKFVVIH